MGILSETLNKHKKESNSAVQSSDIAEKQIHAASAGKAIDWEERHFQICLALLSRTDLHSYHSNTVSTVDPKLPMIIKTADRMVELLKEHHQLAD